MHQAGLIQYADIRSTSKHNPCSLSEIKHIYRSKSIALRLHDLFGVFVIFCTGIGMGFVCFLIELAAGGLTKTKAKRNNKKQTNSIETVSRGLEVATREH